MLRWLIAVAACVAATGCSDRQGRDAQIQERARPEQAGPTHPLITAGHLARAEVAGLTGDQRAMRRQIEAMQADQMRSMHLAGPAPRIDHEAARAAVRPLSGVQSSAWVARPVLLLGTRVIVTFQEPL